MSLRIEPGADRRRVVEVLAARAVQERNERELVERVHPRPRERHPAANEAPPAAFEVQRLCEAPLRGIQRYGSFAKRSSASTFSAKGERVEPPSAHSTEARRSLRKAGRRRDQPLALETGRAMRADLPHLRIVGDLDERAARRVLHERDGVEGRVARADHEGVHASHPEEAAAALLDEATHRLAVAAVGFDARDALVGRVGAILEAQQVHHHDGSLVRAGEEFPDLLGGRILGDAHVDSFALLLRHRLCQNIPPQRPCAERRGAEPMKPWIARILVVLVVLALGAAALMRVHAVQDRVVRAAIVRMVASQPDELFEPDALRVLACGTASPLPHPTRAKACVAVFAAGRFWVVDTGSGSWNRLALLRVDGARIGGVLLTHLHSDHIGDLGEFDLNTWAMGRPGPLRVFGPPGVERVVAGFEESYALDAQYRIAHHGPEFFSEASGVLEPHPIRVRRPAAGRKCSSRRTACASPPSPYITTR